MKRNTFTRLAALALTLILALSLTACGGKDNSADNNGDTKTTVKIGVPNDTTNEARALLLLQENGCPICCPIWTTLSSTATTPSMPV